MKSRNSLTIIILCLCFSLALPSYSHPEAPTYAYKSPTVGDFIVIPDLPKYDFLLQKSTYIGGNHDDYGLMGALNSLGELTIVFQTKSSGLPSDVFAAKTTGTYSDLYIMHFDAEGNNLWSTYFGSTYSDYIGNVVVDSKNDIIISGYTNHDDLQIADPIIPYNAGDDGFVVKFTRFGEVLWGTYYGGSANDILTEVAIDHDDNIYVMGSTYSTDIPMINSYDGTNAGEYDLFVTSFNPDGQQLWGTYLGGSDRDFARGLAVDKDGDVYGVGEFDSIDAELKNSFQSTFAGVSDGYVFKLSSNGYLHFASYLGGMYSDGVWDIKTDANNYVYVTGHTSSPDFPMLQSDAYIWYSTIFLSKITSTGNLLWTTTVASTGTDSTPHLEIDDNNDIYVSGKTSGTNFPLKYPQSDTKQAGYDAVIMKINSLGDLLWSTYYGGSGGDYITSLIVSPNHLLYVLGYTDSADLQMRSSYNDTYGGGYDAYIAQFYDPFSDYDGDGLQNIFEGTSDLKIDDSDTDGDGMPDGWEYNYGLNPHMSIDQNWDLDGDGMPNLWEYEMGLFPHFHSDAMQDKDLDGLMNFYEYGCGTSAIDIDTDDDLVGDGDEVLKYFTNPLSNDTDSDRLLDHTEIFIHHTDPLNNDTDGDGMSDSIEIKFGRDPNKPDITSTSDVTGSTDSTTTSTTTILKSKNDPNTSESVGADDTGVLSQPSILVIISAVAIPVILYRQRK